MVNQSNDSLGLGFCDRDWQDRREGTHISEFVISVLVIN